jgi:hypothetical protein
MSDLNALGWLRPKAQKEIVYSILKPALRGPGFFPKTVGGNDAFVSETKYGGVYFYFQFKDSCEVDFTGVLLSFLEIEKNIIEIAKPGNNYEHYIANNDYLITTVGDKKIDFYDSTADPLRTPSQAEAFAHAYLNYVKGQGLAFIEKYSYLPNVLAEMDRLEEEGKRWINFIGGGPDYMFRGLIISKMCNDPNYLKKISSVDSIFYDPKFGLEDWLPYYDRLKERLKYVEPKYEYKLS